MDEKDLRQAEYFANRLVKNEKALRRWAAREGVFALRLYDRDIPEIPLALELYRAEEGPAASISFYERPYDKDPAEEADWLDLMAATAAKALALPEDSVFLRTRKRQRGLGQYERLGSGLARRIVVEGGSRLIVNLSDYLDTGLFLDHRPLRARVRAEAAGTRVLNLFCYTGAFSVHAAAGGAVRVDSVDLSNTYLAWAKENLALNGISEDRAPLHRADVRLFLEAARRRAETWDLIIADPPTFSNSKAAPEDFDVNRDWPELVEACLRLLAPGGKLYFSSNSRRLRFDPALVRGRAQDLGEATIPPDVRDKKAHRAWLIERDRIH